MKSMQQDAFIRRERRRMREVPWQLRPVSKARKQFSCIIYRQNTNVNNAFTGDERDTSAGHTRTGVARRNQNEVEIGAAIPLTFNDRAYGDQHVVSAKPDRVLHMSEHGG